MSSDEPHPFDLDASLRSRPRKGFGVSFKTKLFATFGLALASFIFVAVLSYRRIRQDDENQRWVEHTHSVMERLDTFRSDLSNAAIGERGYVATGEGTYLSEYQDAVQRVHDDSTELANLTADNPGQQYLLKELILVC